MIFRLSAVSSMGRRCTVNHLVVSLVPSTANLKSVYLSRCLCSKFTPCHLIELSLIVYCKDGLKIPLNSEKKENTLYCCRLTTPNVSKPKIIQFKIITFATNQNV